MKSLFAYCSAILEGNQETLNSGPWISQALGRQTIVKLSWQFTQNFQCPSTDPPKINDLFFRHVLIPASLT